MGIGLKKMANFEFPVYVELRGVQGQMRMRIETIPDPPFLKCVSRVPLLSSKAKFGKQDRNGDLSHDAGSRGCRQTSACTGRHDFGALLGTLIQETVAYAFQFSL
jgi:hypothetical protein